MKVFFRQKGTVREHVVHKDSVSILGSLSLPERDLPAEVSLTHLPVIFMSGKKWGPLSGKIERFFAENSNFKGVIVYSYSWSNGYGDGIVFASFEAVQASKILSGESLVRFEEVAKADAEEKAEREKKIAQGCKTFTIHQASPHAMTMHDTGGTGDLLVVMPDGQIVLPTTRLYPWPEKYRGIKAYDYRQVEWELVPLKAMVLKVFRNHYRRGEWICDWHMLQDGAMTETQVTTARDWLQSWVGDNLFNRRDTYCRSDEFKVQELTICGKTFSH